MERIDRKPDVPNGGGARRDGSFYHVSFRSGSRSKGSCARSSHAYITRTEEYDDPERDEAVYAESDHMPAWAEDDPREYWDGADLYERENGRLYVSADFALPRDLDPDDQIALAHAFAQELTSKEHLPYTLAIHAGYDADGREHNPHAHLMISERRNDGLERSREQYFRRANAAHPERGGAPKSRTFHGREWVEQAREHWAALTNAMLERQARGERVDHRSYARQGLDREPSEHFGPDAAHMVHRGHDHERLNNAATAVDERDQLRAVEQAITRIEAAREALVRDLEHVEEYPPARGHGGGRGPARDDDTYPGR